MIDKKYTVKPLPIEKKVVAEIASLNRHVNLMHSNFLVDITAMRQKMKAYKQSSKISLSILSCLLYCFARTLDKHKEAFVLLGRGNKLFTFEEADVFFPFELSQDGKKFVWYKIIRRINKKTIFELQNDIKSVASIKMTLSYGEKFFLKFPLFIKNIFYNFTMRNPLLRKSYFGNVYFSSTIQSSNKRLLAHGMPTPFHSSSLFVGTYIDVKNPIDNMPNLNMLAITISLDHTISDGPMLAKLVTDFFNQVENFEIPTL